MSRWRNRFSALVRTGMPEVFGCPVPDADRIWIDEQLIWLADEFGAQAFQGPVVLPTAEFFAEPYGGEPRDAARLLDQVAGYLHVESRRIDLEIYSADQMPGTAGHYQVRDGRPVISIERGRLERSGSVISTIAHELCHDRLIGEGRIDPAHREDHERLTDLLAVFLGLGVFQANHRTEFSLTGGGLRISRLGYLTEPMYGYALARYAWLRGEYDPGWAAYLDLGPAGHYRRAGLYLGTHG
ncbi:hypothetical protein R8Z50_19925 [Longispora sp. K20-0274]|uniref:hypothetical protein n=1 Tax=Longispora sp. K20-0274 TaxID=3088255 RepID=UPI003999558C